MYDLANDPHEMQNLFDDSGYKTLRNELEDMIAARPGTVLNEFDPPVGDGVIVECAIHH